MQWGRLGLLWSRYVNADHFTVESLAVLALRTVVPWYIAVPISVLAWSAHEVIDGDLTWAKNAPWEGLKDILWGLLPLLGYIR